MSAIGIWVSSILGIVIIGTLIDLVLPSGRMNKYINSIFATITVLLIVVPLPNLIKNGFKTDGSLITAQFELDEDYLEFSKKTKLSYLAKGVSELLAEEGIANAIVEIDGDIINNNIEIKLVKINIENVVIDSKISHINKYELVSDLVTKNLSVDKGMVIING